MALPTQRDVAKRVGLSQACVSKALRGAPGISAETRERVRTAAAALGYRPDPLLSALVGRRSSEPPITAIAYVRQNLRNSAGDPYCGAVAERCAEIGLNLLVLDAADDDAALQAQLDRRRIAGVVFGHTSGRLRRLAWERMRVVHCGMVVPPERGDVVAPDVASAVPTAWRAMVSHGYERIAAVLFNTDPRAHSEQMLAGALLALERVVGDSKRFTSWIGPWARAHEAVAWVERQGVQALLGYTGGLRGLDLPYAALIAKEGMAGMVIPLPDIAKAAVDLLLQRLREPPDVLARRHMHLIEMSWRDGRSLPARKAGD